MLPASARLRRREEFTRTVRGGRKAARGSVVVHCLLRIQPPGGELPSSDVDCDPSRVGFVVPKAVGSAVARNLVTRRLRHLVRPRLAELPPGTWVVVRALPSASEMSYDRLGADLDAALEAACARAAGQARGERRRDTTADPTRRERAR